MLILSTLVTGCLDAAFSLSGFDLRTPYILGTVTNVILVALTAGRILWIRRETFYVGLDDKFRNRYNIAVVIVLESGAVYCMYGILLVIVMSLKPIPMIFEGVAAGLARQIINIAPTLTIVRVGLGHNIQDTIRHRTEKPAARRTPIPSQPTPRQLSGPREVLHIKPMNEA
ncbi:hypothetical protein C8R44DRAFT_799233 [Mycena epipterygia]|nr:hypothetical protein C8R44DRAFT_799233 [Mycena epipterygia]